jgi:cellulose synthase/poly-beta-1,6-N-acetylglucosamine synthase-like glycosyltransferase
MVPAHNEAAGIENTIRLIKDQLLDDDRLIVIADNCEDQTANISRAAGAEAIERHNDADRGKGYALAYGIDHISNRPCDVVVFVDADTRPHEGAIDRIIRDAAKFNRPIQGVFTDAVRSREPRQQWSAFAVTLKNEVRPLGWHFLGFPCLLTGSGMAIPYQTLRQVDLKSSNIVEDMKLGIDLTIAGSPPRFCPDARFESDDAPNLKSATTRRQRWEHGHVQSIIKFTPRLVLQALRRFNLRSLALALELSVPPLTLLFILITGLVIICSIWAGLGGSAIPLQTLLIGGGIAGIAILAAWARFGRKLLSPKILCLLPVYVLWKIPIYLKLIIAPERKWIRTERNSLS